MNLVGISMGKVFFFCFVVFYTSFSPSPISPIILLSLLVWSEHHKSYLLPQLLPLCHTWVGTSLTTPRDKTQGAESHAGLACTSLTTLPCPAQPCPPELSRGKQHTASATHSYLIISKRDRSILFRNVTSTF